MRKFFQPSDGPSWLGDVLTSIRAALSDIWPTPLKVADYTTTGLPAAADWTQGLVWDSTAATVKWSDGTNWKAPEPSITAGTTSQYWRGDKTWQTLNKAAVGLGNVDNTADAVKVVLSASKFTTARTLAITGDVAWTSPAFDGTGNVTAAGTIQANVVTFSKFVAATQKALVGASAAGNFGEVTIGAGLTLVAGVLDRVTQTTVSGNAGTATALQTGRTIAMSGDVVWSVTFDGSGNVTAAGTIQAASVTLAKMTNLAANSILGNNTGSAATPLALTAAQVRTLLGLAAVATSGSASDITTGLLPVAQGSTGIASYAVGDTLFASGSAAFSKLAAVATGNVLISGGVTTAPAWGKVALTTHVSGTLPLGNLPTQTGTGNIVLSASPTLTGTLTTAAITASGLVTTSGYRDNGGLVARFEGSGGGVPTGSAGVGLEVFQSSSTAHIQAYNRTSSAFAAGDLNAASWTIKIADAAVFSINSVLVNAANDAAAAAASVPVLGMYRNGSILMVRVV